MKYKRFEDLPVWKSSINLAEHVYSLTENKVFFEAGDLVSQLRRASLSVSNNIAEGFERGSTNELIMYLYIARGSAGEVRSMLNFCDRRKRFLNLKSEISNLKSTAESCSRQIRAWADSLQNTDIKGQRHLNNLSHEQWVSKGRRERFLEGLDDMVQRSREKTTQTSSKIS